MILVDRPVHHATPYIKYIPLPGAVRNSYEFSSLPSLPRPACRLPCTQAHLPTLPCPYHTRVCIPARCFTKCTHCTGFNHPPRGRTCSFGAALRRDNGMLRVLRGGGGGGGKRSDTREPAVPKLAKNRLQLSFHAIGAISPRLLR